MAPYAVGTTCLPFVFQAAIEALTVPLVYALTLTLIVPLAMPDQVVAVVVNDVPSVAASPHVSSSLLSFSSTTTVADADPPTPYTLIETMPGPPSWYSLDVEVAVTPELVNNQSAAATLLVLLRQRERLACCRGFFQSAFVEKVGQVGTNVSSSYLVAHLKSPLVDRDLRHHLICLFQFPPQNENAFRIGERCRLFSKESGSEEDDRPPRYPLGTE